MGYRNGIVLQMVIISVYLGFNSKYTLPSLVNIQVCSKHLVKGIYVAPKDYSILKTVWNPSLLLAV